MSADNWENVEEAGGIKAFKVLIVDDSPFVRSQIKDILRNEHVTLIEAEDGEVGLEMVRTHPDINLIFCDINMPRMDGLGFLQQLGHLGSKGQPPCHVIMLTTENKLDKVLQGKKLGATAWLIKPPAPQDIIKLITKFRASA